MALREAVSSFLSGAQAQKPVSCKTFGSCGFRVNGELDVVQPVAHMLEHICECNNQAQDGSLTWLSLFHTKRATVSLSHYALRLSLCFNCSPECFVIAMIYLSRFLAATGAVLSTDNVHKLFLASLTVATKYHSDEHLVNEAFAQAGGVKLRQLNKLEAMFLAKLGWSMAVSAQDFNDCMTALCLFRHSTADSEASHCCRHCKGGSSSWEASTAASSLGPMMQHVSLRTCTHRTESSESYTTEGSSCHTAVSEASAAAVQQQGSFLARARCCWIRR